MRLADALAAAARSRWAGQSTADRSAARARRCLAWLGTRRVTEARLRAMVDAMREAGLGPASVNRHLSALSAVLAEAAVVDSTGQPLRLPWQREPRGRTRVLTGAEVTLLRSACLLRCPRSAALVGFLHETGMRVSEALALRDEDVGDGWARVRTSKNGDPRMVPLTAEAVRCWRRGWAGLGQSRFNHVFRWARQQVPTLRDDREVVPHALRHGLASRLVDEQVSLPVVAAWLGHRSIRSTTRYCHPGRAGLAEAARRLAEGATGGTGSSPGQSRTSPAEDSRGQPGG